MGWFQKVKNSLLIGGKQKKEYNEILEQVKKKWDGDTNAQLRVQYMYFFEKEPVRNNYILYESYSGRGMIDNPYALFQYLLSNEKYEKYVHVWVIDDFEVNGKIIEKYEQYENVIFVEYQSEEYLHYLATVKYLINNMTFPKFFTKREGQIYVNTWHGIPLKTLGYDIPGGNVDAANTVRNFLSTDYLLSPNDFMTEVYKRKFKLDGIFEGKIMQEGQPRNDAYFHTEKEKVIKTLQENGVSVVPDRKVILYAPTWRGENYGSPETGLEDYFEVIRRIEKNVDTKEYQILVKPHQVVYKYIKNSRGVTGQFIPAVIDANEILSIVDILISDYSSIYFDFLITERPVLFFIRNLEEYLESRGLYFGLEKLPGPIARNYEELECLISDMSQAMESYQKKYQEEKQWACGKDDGHVCERVIETIFENRKESVCISCNDSKKEKILIRGGGFVTNGITFSLMTLFEHIDYTKYDVTLSVGPTRNKEAKENIKQVIPEVRVLYWDGRHNASYEEETMHTLIMEHGFGTGWDAPEDMYKRELRRLFGESKFDYVIEYTGYSKYFSVLFSFFDNARKFIWMHNDLKKELSKGEKGGSDVGPILRICISTYPYMDKVVGCSELTMQVNKENFATERTKDKFTYARNMINLKRILGEEHSVTAFSTEKDNYYVAGISEDTSSTYEVEVVSVPKKEHINFVTMGRLSPEKNQDNLIKAFGKLYRENPAVRLYILGEGPWRKNLEDLIEEEHLKGIVHLVGILMKPFGFLKSCDCFILPSHYEGQPLVIQEARTLHMPIIVSDFSTVKDVLIEDGQLLIGQETEEVYEGMKAFLEGKVPDYEFDCSAYNEEVYKEFERLFTVE